jgi:hypothetical protein
MDVDKEIEIGMNLEALRYDLKLCREHGTYVDTETLARVIHDVLGDVHTAELAEKLSALSDYRVVTAREDDGGL